jgi:hypothetical protein
MNRVNEPPGQNRSAESNENTFSISAALAAMMLFFLNTIAGAARSVADQVSQVLAPPKLGFAGIAPAVRLDGDSLRPRSIRSGGDLADSAMTNDSIAGGYQPRASRHARHEFGGGGRTTR